MANRRDLQADHVTAGKFIPVGKDSVSLKQKLRQVGQTVSTSKNNVRVEVIKGIATDLIITPEEKESLKVEMDYITAGYTQMKSYVESVGLEESTSFTSFKNRYEKLLEAVEPVLADMETSSSVSKDFSSLFSSYTSWATELNNYLLSFQTGAQDKVNNYTLRIVSSTTDLNKDLKVTLTANIYLYDSNVTQSEMGKIKVLDEDHPYPTLFIWEFTGLADNIAMQEEALGNRVVEIPYDSISDSSFTATFMSNIEVSGES